MSLQPEGGKLPSLILFPSPPFPETDLAQAAASALLTSPILCVLPAFSSAANCRTLPVLPDGSPGLRARHAIDCILYCALRTSAVTRAAENCGSL